MRKRRERAREDRRGRGRGSAELLGYSGGGER